jgi:predicted MFS family arabinose efflux permease
VVGAIVGGWSGDHIGLRPTVIIAGVGTLIAGLWLWLSPVRKVREVTVPMSDDSTFES